MDSSFSGVYQQCDVSTDASGSLTALNMFSFSGKLIEFTQCDSLVFDVFVERKRATVGPSVAATSSGLFVAAAAAATGDRKYFVFYLKTVSFVR